MALTATATVQTHTTICKVLGMSDPVVIVESLNKPNIRYIVQLNPGTLEQALHLLPKKYSVVGSIEKRLLYFIRL